MLLRALKIARNAVQHTLLTQAPRSGHWPKVRKEHLATHPTCESCGAKWMLNVHHVHPFHLHPDLELDPTNLITLCVAECHLLIGHGDDFRAYNPDVRADAATILASSDRQAAVKEMAPKVKAKRLFQ